MQVLGVKLNIPKPKITITPRDIAKVLPAATQQTIAQQVQEVTGTAAIKKNVVLVGIMVAATLGLIALAVYRKGRR